MEIKRIENLPYNRMLLSTSPNEFFAMQRYDPMSSFWKFRMVTVIRASYADIDVSWTLYFGDETIISPVEWRWQWGNKWIRWANRNGLCGCRAHTQTIKIWHFFNDHMLFFTLMPSSLSCKGLIDYIIFFIPRTICVRM